MTPLTVVHISGGAVGVVTGFTALFAPKGSTLHRRSGFAFVAGMATMGVTGALLGNIVGGAIAAYTVITGLTTMRPVSKQMNVGLMLFALIGGSLLMMDGIRTLAAGHLLKDGVPVPMILFLGTVMLLASLGDYRMIRIGLPRGKPRLVRHLWRMCFGLFMASGSFFTIRKRVAMILPEPFLDIKLRMIPVVLPLLAILYWVWRLRRKRAPKLVYRNAEMAWTAPETATEN